MSSLAPDGPLGVVIEPHPCGCVVEIQAQPRARRNGLAGVHNGRLRVQVTQTPEKGKANAALLKTLARELALRRSQLELVTGETASHKRVLVRDVAVEELRERLARRLAQPPR